MRVRSVGQDGVRDAYLAVSPAYLGAAQVAFHQHDFHQHERGAWKQLNQIHFHTVDSVNRMNTILWISRTVDPQYLCFLFSPQYLCFSNTFVFGYFANPQYLIPAHRSQVALPAAGSNEWAASVKSRADTGTAEVAGWFPSAAARALSDVIILELGSRPRPGFGSRGCIFLILGRAVGERAFRG